MNGDAQTNLNSALLSTSDRAADCHHSGERRRTNSSTGQKTGLAKSSRSVLSCTQREFPGASIGALVALKERGLKRFSLRAGPTTSGEQNG
jgi:hypothetical protein